MTTRQYLQVAANCSHRFDGQVRQVADDEDGGENEHHPRGARWNLLPRLT